MIFGIKTDFKCCKLNFMNNSIDSNDKPHRMPKENTQMQS